MSEAFFYFGVCGPPNGFRLFSPGGELVAAAGSSRRSWERSEISLGDGEHTCTADYTDEWGITSEAVSVELNLGEDAVSRRLRPVTRVTARAIAAGRLSVDFVAVNINDDLFADAAAYEVAIEGSESTILATVAAGPTDRAWLDQEIDPPVPHGASVVVVVRASDGETDGERGVWVAASAVRVDAEAPTVPEAIAVTDSRC
ncbi:MAG: hypothetical protein AAF593_00205 [Planctomycetota bacterium]